MTGHSGQPTADRQRSACAVATERQGPAASSRRWEVIIGGEGGQGVVLAGALLGEAAVRAGLNAAHTSSYGIATRGGFTRSDVIVAPGEEEIAYPRVRRPHVVVALSPEAASRLQPLCGPDTLLILDPGSAAPSRPAAAEDSRCAGTAAGYRELVLPLREAARQAGGERVINMVALGALLGVTGMFPAAVLEEVLRARFPGERAEINCRAMRSGYELAVSGPGKG
ncbi:MAG: 2-oxoacid:acceptor oxidoreductase family protein [Bacillota bacterium]|nr:2-oxoacid:acceptor oxidoreductase family protein [Bacillota bacterium]MDI7249737.1 2-oxoacid:acceptor oxidoreductase family protein [Bacillota bacterium]